MSEPTPWTIGKLLTWTAEFLASRGSDSARLDAEVLLAHARGCKRIDLYTVFDEPAPDGVRDAFKKLVKRRGDGEPVAYLVGKKEFYSLEFEVTGDTLIPRPETELIVVRLTDLAKEAGGGEAIKVCDVGTGSGVLAVCAAKYLENANVLATDASPAALEVAKRNADRHGVGGRTFFVEADLFPAHKPDMRLDYIVSNPPYITTDELTRLSAGVADYEPRLALDGGPEGTTVIERLLPAAARQLKPGGVLLIEISPMIAERVEGLVNETPGLVLKPTINDLSGHPRVIEAMKEEGV
ncbi:MAG: peptide chain release factor N(5)-glutamine methyltransferase [Planctomycetota bacterium]